MSDFSVHAAPYSLAIARRPNVIRRTALEVQGDAVLGFGLYVKPVSPAADHIDCRMLWAGLITPTVVKSCLDALAEAFGADAIGATVRLWLLESDSARSRAREV